MNCNKIKKLLLACMLMVIGITTNAQVTTNFYGSSPVYSDDQSGALYSVAIYNDCVHVTIELVPRKNMSRMNFWTGPNPYISTANGKIKLKFLGALSNDKQSYHSCQPKDRWGWNDVERGKKYRYTLVFAGTIPAGVTDFALVDDYAEYHGYSFRGYTLENPNIFETNLDATEIQNNIDNNNDGICGIYEEFGGDGYRLGCIKEDGEYFFIYMGGHEDLDWWHNGDVKAYLRPSSTPGLYKAEWIDAYKSLEKDAYVVFEGGSMTVVVNKEEYGFLKMYPYTQSGQGNSQGYNEKGSTSEDRWTGTCVAIGSNTVVTNYHVVDNARTLVVTGFNGDKNHNYTAQVILTDPTNDLAVMKITDRNFPGFRIRYGMNTHVADLGTEIFVLGYPLTTTMGEDIKLTTGVVSAKTGFQGDVSSYQISAPIQPGNSGGPLFDNKGNLIGVVNAKHTGAENVGYAIKLGYLKNLLESSNEVIPLNYSNSISTLSLSEKVKAVSSCVLLVKANFTETSLHSSSSNTTFGDNNTTTYQDPNDEIREQAKSLFESSQRKYENNDIEGAYADVCESVDLSPTANSQFVKAFLAFEFQRDFSAAVSAATYCLQEDYKVDDCLFYIVQSYIYEGKYEDAIYYLNSMMVRNKNNIYALENLGICYMNLGKIDEANRYYLEAIKYEGTVDYDFSYIYYNLAAENIAVGMIKESVVYLQKAVEHNPVRGYIWDTYGMVCYKLYKYDEAIKYMNAAIINGEKDRTSTWLSNSYYYRGLAHLHKNKLKDGYLDLKRAEELGNTKATEELKKINSNRIDFNQVTGYDRIINNPSVRIKGDTQISIKAVEIKDEYTAVYIDYKNIQYEGGWYGIDRNAYISDRETNKKYRLLATENCDVLPNHTSIGKGQTKSFVLYFEAMPNRVRNIDFIESESSEWKFYNISVQ